MFYIFCFGFAGVFTATPVHEGAHYLMALLVGFSVSSVRVGRDGWRGITFSRWGTSFAYLPPFWGGEVVEDTRGKETPCKIRFYVLAGPAANITVLIVAVIGYVVWEHNIWAFVSFGVSHAIIARNLLPFERKDKETGCSKLSDGKAICDPMGYHATVLEYRAKQAELAMRGRSKPLD